MTGSGISDRVDKSARGGTQTPKGKCASRSNAIKHGLSAKVLLPEILGEETVSRCYERLQEEWRPSTATQRFLVREMARHEGALERAEEMEAAVLRRGARGAPRVAFGEANENDLLDATLAGAGTSDALERIARYRKSHERAYLRSLNSLREAKASAATADRKAAQQNQRQFSSESECEAYLVARLVSKAFVCPDCQGVKGIWISSRNVWQCRTCRRQSGIRATTVMERSRVGLLSWFCAIEALLKDPMMSTMELSVVTGIRRHGTVRRMAGKIRRAMDSPQRSDLLARLDQVFHVSASCSAEPSVRRK